MHLIPFYGALDRRRFAAYRNYTPIVRLLRRTRSLEDLGVRALVDVSVEMG
jgi:hypothetical protein